MKIKDIIKATSDNTRIQIFEMEYSDICNKRGGSDCPHLPEYDAGEIDELPCKTCDYKKTIANGITLFEGMADKVPYKIADKTVKDIFPCYNKPKKSTYLSIKV